jgi:hypothetical protein
LSAPKFTPGPWVVVPRYDDNMALINGANDTVAEVATGIPRGEANAALIAAAPDMHEALTAFVESMRSVDALDPTDLPRRMGLLVPIFRLALTKAEGSR